MARSEMSEIHSFGAAMVLLRIMQYIMYIIVLFFWTPIVFVPLVLEMTRIIFAG